MRQWANIAGVLLLVCFCQVAGWWRPMDLFLRDLRFTLDSRPPSGNIVLADVDARSLDAVGVWPWPRRVYATLLNHLSELGASDIAFDIDFSQASLPQDDAAFEAALAAAGGYAILPTFRQLGSVASFTKPLNRFATEATTAAVNVSADSTGIVRRVPRALMIDGTVIPSLPTALAMSEPDPDREFVIDYSIDARRIDRIPVADILSGAVAPERLRDKQVVIGASALELRDTMMTPKHGLLPGAVIQILAADSLKLGRGMAPPQPGATLGALLVLSGALLLLRRRLAGPAGLMGVAGAAVVIELMAFLLQSREALLINTAGLQAALAGTMVVALALEAAEKRKLHLEATHQRTEALERLADLARHDPLTGALTRYEFMARIDERIRSGRTAWVVAYSLPRFDRISEAMGYRIADLVLKEVVQRSRRAGAVDIGRTAGWDFAVMPPAETDREGLEAFCARLRQELQQVFMLEGHRVVVGCTIGVAASHDLASKTDAGTILLSRAEMARSSAGTVPAHPVSHYQPAMEERIASARTLELALKEAVERDGIQVHYQGQFDLQTGALVGAEALARWTHPELGPVSPARFVALAEETGLTVALGASVMRTACREAARWARDCRLAVNVSPTQFELDDVVGLVSKCLEESGLPASRLDIEITEGLLLKATPAVLGALEGVHRLGVGIALDDFGTGYSSMGYLGTLPFDKLKIDRSFIEHVTEDRRGGAIVETILMLCQRLNLTVVAEGIETEEQAEWLRRRGCHIGQGYLMHRPASGEDFRRLVVAGRPAFARNPRNLAAT